MQTSSLSNTVLMGIALATLLAIAYLGLYLLYLVPLEKAGEQITANVGTETQHFSHEIYYSDIDSYPPDSIVAVVNGDETRYFVVDSSIEEGQRYESAVVAFD